MVIVLWLDWRLFGGAGIKPLAIGVLDDRLFPAPPRLVDLPNPPPPPEALPTLSTLQVLFLLLLTATNPCSSSELESPPLPPPPPPQPFKFLSVRVFHPPPPPPPPPLELPALEPLDERLFPLPLNSLPIDAKNPFFLTGTPRAEDESEPLPERLRRGEGGRRARSADCVRCKWSPPRVRELGGLYRPPPATPISDAARRPPLRRFPSDESESLPCCATLLLL